MPGARLALVMSEQTERMHVVSSDAQGPAADGGAGPSIDSLWQVLDSLPFRVFWKDESLRYCGANQLFLNDAGLESPEELIGCTDFDLPWTRKEAEFFRACDRETMLADEAQIGIVESQTTTDERLAWLETHKIPMHDANGHVSGIIGIYRDITETKQAEVELKQSHDALEQSNDELESLVFARTRELQHLAQTDSLTDLVNRDHFVRFLSDDVQRSSKFAVLFVDLDRFKTINDSFGHRVGDGLLKRFADVLKASCRPNAVIGRFGGDEFTILLRSIRNAEEAFATSERILTMLKAPMEVEGYHLGVGASIGIVLNLDNQYKSGDDVIRDADLAMYAAKGNGKSQYSLFRPEMLDEARKRTEIEQQMQVGIQEKQFVPAFQPICRIEDETVIAFEVLARWNHPQLGLVAPGHFLSIAEETGKIGELGISLIEQACVQLQHWHTMKATEHLTLSVNLSPLQVTPELPTVLEEIVHAHQLQPQSFELEITETLLLESDDCIETLERLREIGFSLVLDDFGTGFSSLSYLHRLPVDKLKIDRSFVSSMVTEQSSRDIVGTIIGLSHMLGLSVVAEGVETPEQLKMLREQRCNFVQGYYFSKPILDADLETYIRNMNGTCEPVLGLELTNSQSSPTIPHSVSE